jgi:hypothetical protein
VLENQPQGQWKNRTGLVKYNAHSMIKWYDVLETRGIPDSVGVKHLMMNQDSGSSNGFPAVVPGWIR